jgi:hypothetical protein
VDLRTGHLGYFDFGTDDAKALVKAGIKPPAWKEPQVVGIELTRFSHGNQTKGRFKEKVTLIDLDPDLLAQARQDQAHVKARVETHVRLVAHLPGGVPGAGASPARS